MDSLFDSTEKYVIYTLFSLRSLIAALFVKEETVIK